MPKTAAGTSLVGDASYLDCEAGRRALGSMGFHFGFHGDIQGGAP